MHGNVKQTLRCVVEVVGFRFHVRCGVLRIDVGDARGYTRHCGEVSRHPCVVVVGRGGEVVDAFGQAQCGRTAVLVHVVAGVVSRENAQGVGAGRCQQRVDVIDQTAAHRTMMVVACHHQSGIVHQIHAEHVEFVVAAVAGGPSYGGGQHALGTDFYRLFHLAVGGGRRLQCCHLGGHGSRGGPVGRSRACRPCDDGIGAAHGERVVRGGFFRRGLIGQDRGCAEGIHLRSHIQLLRSECHGGPCLLHRSGGFRLFCASALGKVAFHLHLARGLAVGNRTVRHDGIACRVGRKVAHEVSSGFGNVDRERVVAAWRARLAVVVIRCLHCSRQGVEHVHTEQVECMAAADVGKRDGLLTALREVEVASHGLHNVGSEGVLRGGGLHHSGGDFGFSRFPGKRFGHPAVLGEFVRVLVAAGFLLAHRRFQSGKDLVAGNHCAPGVAHHDGRRVARDVVDGVEHRGDVVHQHVSAVGRDFQLSAQVVRTVAQHGAPDNLQVVVGVDGHQLLAVEAFCAAHGEGVAREVFHGHSAEGHGRRAHLVIVLQFDFEKVLLSLEIHGSATAEGQLSVSLDKGGGEQVVGQRVGARDFGQIGLPGLRFLRENHSLCLRCLRRAESQGRQQPRQCKAFA